MAAKTSHGNLKPLNQTVSRNRYNLIASFFRRGFERRVPEEENHFIFVTPHAGFSCSQYGCNTIGQDCGKERR